MIIRKREGIIINKNIHKVGSKALSKSAIFPTHKEVLYLQF
jgi:hypothetical protein